MLKRLLQKQGFRYFICGVITAAFNILLISYLIEALGFDTPILRNIANVLALEISLLFSFFVYKIWVWSGGIWNFKKVFFYQIPLYHLSVGVAAIARCLILFPILDWMKINYSINTLLGIVLGAILNYTISDKVVFRVK